MSYPSSFREVNVTAHKDSWDVSHTDMTGGTLKVIKEVSVLGDEEAYIYPYILLLPLEKDFEDTELHKGVHTFEHYTAYSNEIKEGLREALVKLSEGQLTKKAVLDISPYIFKGHLALRVLSVANFSEAMLSNAMELTLHSMKIGLESSEEIPFANQEQCGQFRFHSKEKALEIVEAALIGFAVMEQKPIKTRKNIAVADLRLLKPELEFLEEGLPLQYFFSPEVSYYLTEYFEKNFPHYWQELGLGVPPLLLAAKYGCETGAYIGFDFDTLLEDIDKQAKKIHIVITIMLMDVLKYTDGGTLMTQTQWALTLIQKFNQDVYEEAEERMKQLPKRVTSNRSW